MSDFELPPIPPRMRRLPRDRHGRPVPWFVADTGDEPDFRIVGSDKFVDALKFGLCWVCGGGLGGFKAFVIGPMCAVNRTTSEPPCHRDCAIFSATACPFLSVPGMRRRTTGLPEDKIDPGGHMLLRNPGVVLVYVTRQFKLFRAFGGNNGVLIDLGNPVEALWYAHGRPATRGEVTASIDSGMPALREVAAADPQPGALEALAAQLARALPLLPAEARS